MDAKRFEWDLNKAATNEAKHGISFIGATAIFLDSHRLEEDTSRPEHGETRFKAIGTVSGEIIAVIFTYRQERRRIISARRARPDERQRYDQGHPIS